MNEQEKQERIDAWFQNLMEQVGQHPFSVNPDLAVDVGRIYKTLDQQEMTARKWNVPLAKVKRSTKSATNCISLHRKANCIFSLWQKKQIAARSVQNPKVGCSTI